MTRERTTEERIEQNAHDIIVTCDRLLELTKGSTPDTPEHHIYLNTLSAKLHAEKILGGVQS